MKFWDNIKTIRKHERMRQEWLAKQASESRSQAQVTRGTGAPLYGRVETDSGRLAARHDRSVRLIMTLKAENEDLKASLRAMRVKEHNAFLEWLAEPENFNLMMRQRPDLMRRLIDTIEDMTPIPSSIYER